MKDVVGYTICAIVLFCGIKESIKTTLSENTCKNSLNKGFYYFSIIISFLIIMTNMQFFINEAVKIKYKYLFLLYNTRIINIIILIFMFLIIHLIVYLFLKIATIPLKSLYYSNNKKSPMMILISIISGSIKGLSLILIIFIGVITFNRTIAISSPISFFEDISAYNKLYKIVVEESYFNYKVDLPSNYIPTSKTLVYYNGVTLEEGIRSTEEIDNKAKELVKFCSDDRSKAKRIYTWIGSTIEYDLDKAEQALNEKILDGSGSIAAWNNKKGICFDYACLFVSMARAVNLDVRLVTGKAFDGKSYGSHAWNQVYLSDEDKWINVDCTFYVSGDYFDSPLFSEDHILEEIAGEW